MVAARANTAGRVRTHGELTREERAARTADIVKRHDHGETFSAIGKHYKLSAPTVHNIYWREINSIRSENTVEHIKKMIRQLEEQEEDIRALIGRKHYAISEGHLVYLGEGEPPLEDDDFALRALKDLRALWAQKAKLLGLNAPDKVQQQVEVVQVTQQDLAIRELLQQQKALNQQSTEDVHNGQ